MTVFDDPMHPSLIGRFQVSIVSAYLLAAINAISAGFRPFVACLRSRTLAMTRSLTADTAAVRKLSVNDSCNA